MGLSDRIAGLPAWAGAVIGIILMGIAAAAHILLLPQFQALAIYVLAAVLTGLGTGSVGGFLLALVGAASFTFIQWRLAGGNVGVGQVIINASCALVSLMVPALAAGGLRRAKRSQKLYAKTDQLTGMDNMSAFMEKAQSELKRARRSRQPLSLAYIDIDNLKEINDLLGFLHGDRLLVAFAGDLKNHTRSSDIVARLGGDEFIIMFPETGVEQARGAAAKIHNAFQKVAESQNCHATLTVGLVTVFNPDLELEAVLKQASDLLLQAKGDGGNTVRDGVVG